jgi:hypothetical protein
MARPKSEDITDRLAMRINERVRYIAEIAARAEGISFREYLERALERSFNDVKLCKPFSSSRPSAKQIKGKTVFVDQRDSDSEPDTDKEQPTLAGWEVGLWHETAYERLVALQSVIYALQRNYEDQTLDRLLSPEQKRVWDYLWQHDEYLMSSSIGKRLNERYIKDNWDAIYQAAQGGAK